MTAKNSKESRSDSEPKAAGGREEPGFEKALARLEKIAAEMEAGKLPLETLIRYCNRKLNEVERKIEILVKKGEEVTTEPFESGREEEAPEARAAGTAGQAGPRELF